MKRKRPRLTAMDRMNIESMLKERKSVYAIAKALSRPVSTIVREIKARMVESDKGAAYRSKNRCAKSHVCTNRHVCAQCLRVRPGRDGMLCRLCNRCNSHCMEFVEQKCKRLEKSESRAGVNATAEEGRERTISRSWRRTRESASSRWIPSKA